MPGTAQVGADEAGGPRSPRSAKRTKRRGAEEGACYVDPAKHLWVAEVRLGVGPDGKRRRKRVTSTSKAEVLRKLAVLNAVATRAESGIETSTGAWLTNLAPTRRSAS